LRIHEQEFRSRGANLAVVGLGDANYARAFRDETGITFPLLIDEKRKAYRAVELKQASLLHLFWRENAVARKRAQHAGQRQHRLGKNPMQLGGTFVFEPGNIDRFVHVSNTFGDNAPAEQVVAALGNRV
jgi:peroxiredoxin